MSGWLGLLFEFHHFVVSALSNRHGLEKLIELKRRDKFIVQEELVELDWITFRFKPEYEMPLLLMALHLAIKYDSPLPIVRRTSNVKFTNAGVSMAILAFYRANKVEANKPEWNNKGLSTSDCDTFDHSAMHMMHHSNAPQVNT
jgi:hypothetical protein